MFSYNKIICSLLKKMMPFMFFFNFKFGSSKIKLVEKKFNDTLIHETLHN